MTRILDLLLALPLALATSPLVFLLALYVVAVDGWPAFHRDLRLGHHGRPFRLLKIRSLSRATGAAVTAADDPRLRPWGRFLRRHRLDELPQLWQVVSGRLALVGPRPESPRLVLADDPREEELGRLRPGLVDPALLDFLDEDEMLRDRPDPEAWYRCHLRPRKLEAALAWSRRRRLRDDLLLLLRTAGRIWLPRRSR